MGTERTRGLLSFTKKCWQVLFGRKSFPSQFGILKIERIFESGLMLHFSNKLYSIKKY